MLGLLVLGRYSLEHEFEVERAVRQQPRLGAGLAHGLFRLKAWRGRHLAVPHQPWVHAQE